MHLDLSCQVQEVYQKDCAERLAALYRQEGGMKKSQGDTLSRDQKAVVPYGENHDRGQVHAVVPYQQHTHVNDQENEKQVKQDTASGEQNCAHKETDNLFSAKEGTMSIQHYVAMGSNHTPTEYSSQLTVMHMNHISTVEEQGADYLKHQNAASYHNQILAVNPERNIATNNNCMATTFDSPTDSMTQADIITVRYIYESIFYAQKDVLNPNKKGSINCTQYTTDIFCGQRTYSSHHQQQPSTSDNCSFSADQKQAAYGDPKDRHCDQIYCTNSGPVPCVDFSQLLDTSYEQQYSAKSNQSDVTDCCQTPVTHYQQEDNVSCRDILPARYNIDQSFSELQMAQTADPQPFMSCGQLVPISYEQEVTTGFDNIDVPCYHPEPILHYDQDLPMDLVGNCVAGLTEDSWEEVMSSINDVLVMEPCRGADNDEEPIGTQDKKDKSYRESDMLHHLQNAVVGHDPTAATLSCQNTSMSNIYLDGALSLSKSDANTDYSQKEFHLSDDKENISCNKTLMMSYQQEEINSYSLHSVSSCDNGYGLSPNSAHSEIQPKRDGEASEDATSKCEENTTCKERHSQNTTVGQNQICALSSDDGAMAGSAHSRITGLGSDEFQRLVDIFAPWYIDDIAHHGQNDFQNFLETDSTSNNLTPVACDEYHLPSPIYDEELPNRTVEEDSFVYQEDDVMSSVSAQNWNQTNSNFGLEITLSPIKSFDLNSGLSTDDASFTQKLLSLDHQPLSVLQNAEINLNSEQIALSNCGQTASINDSQNLNSDHEQQDDVSMDHKHSTNDEPERVTYGNTCSVDGNNAEDMALKLLPGECQDPNYYLSYDHCFLYSLDQKETLECSNKDCVVYEHKSSSPLASNETPEVALFIEDDLGFEQKEDLTYGQKPPLCSTPREVTCYTSTVLNANQENATISDTDQAICHNENIALCGQELEMARYQEQNSSGCKVEDRTSCNVVDRTSVSELLVENEASVATEDYNEGLVSDRSDDVTYGEKHHLSLCQSMEGSCSQITMEDTDQADLVSYSREAGMNEEHEDCTDNSSAVLSVSERIEHLPHEREDGLPLDEKQSTPHMLEPIICNNYEEVARVQDIFHNCENEGNCNQKDNEGHKEIVPMSSDLVALVDKSQSLTPGLEYQDKVSLENRDIAEFNQIPAKNEEMDRNCGTTDIINVELQPVLTHENKPFLAHDLIPNTEQHEDKQHTLTSEQQDRVCNEDHGSIDDQQDKLSYSFKGGDQVLLRVVKRTHSSGNKQALMWKGPYSISRIFPNGTCMLMTKNRKLKHRHLTADLILFQEREKYMSTTPSCDKTGELEDITVTVGSDHNSDQKCNSMQEVVSAAHGKSTDMNLDQEPTLDHNQAHTIDNYQKDDFYETANEESAITKKSSGKCVDMEHFSPNRQKPEASCNQQSAAWHERKDAVFDEMGSALSYDQSLPVCHNYKIGDYVLCKQVQRSLFKKEGKSEQWKGPYVISKILNNNTFQLSNKNRTLKQKYPLSQLKPFEEPQIFQTIEPNTFHDQKDQRKNSEGWCQMNDSNWEVKASLGDIEKDSQHLARKCATELTQRDVNADQEHTNYNHAQVQIKIAHKHKAIIKEDQEDNLKVYDKKDAVSNIKEDSSDSIKHTSEGETSSDSCKNDSTLRYDFKVGDSILLSGAKKSQKNGEIRTGGTWKGPYTITRILGNQTCELSRSKRKLKQRYCLSELKPFQEAQASEMKPADTAIVFPEISVLEDDESHNKAIVCNNQTITCSDRNEYVGDKSEHIMWCDVKEPTEDKNNTHYGMKVDQAFHTSSDQTQISDYDQAYVNTGQTTTHNNELEYVIFDQQTPTLYSQKSLIPDKDTASWGDKESIVFNQETPPLDNQTYTVSNQDTSSLDSMKSVIFYQNTSDADSQKSQIPERELSQWEQHTSVTSDKTSTKLYRENCVMSDVETSSWDDEKPLFIEQKTHLLDSLTCIELINQRSEFIDQTNNRWNDQKDLQMCQSMSPKDDQDAITGFDTGAWRNEQKSPTNSNQYVDMIDCYRVGDRVLLNATKQLHSNGRNREPKWKGPYTISKILRNNMCILSNKTRLLKQKQHLSNLKLVLEGKTCELVSPTGKLTPQFQEHHKEDPSNDQTTALGYHQKHTSAKEKNNLTVAKEKDLTYIKGTDFCLNEQHALGSDEKPHFGYHQNSAISLDQKPAVFSDGRGHFTFKCEEVVDTVHEFVSNYHQHGSCASGMGMMYKSSDCHCDDSSESNAQVNVIQDQEERLLNDERGNPSYDRISSLCQETAEAATYSEKCISYDEKDVQSPKQAHTVMEPTRDLSSDNDNLMSEEKENLSDAEKTSPSNHQTGADIPNQNNGLISDGKIALSKTHSQTVITEALDCSNTVCEQSCTPNSNPRRNKKRQGKCFTQKSMHAYQKLSTKEEQKALQLTEAEEVRSYRQDNVTSDEVAKNCSQTEVALEDTFMVSKCQSLDLSLEQSEAFSSIQHHQLRKDPNTECSGKEQVPPSSSISDSRGHGLGHDNQYNVTCDQKGTPDLDLSPFLRYEQVEQNCGNAPSITSDRSGNIPSRLQPAATRNTSTVDNDQNAAFPDDQITRQEIDVQKAAMSEAEAEKPSGTQEEEGLSSHDKDTTDCKHSVLESKTLKEFTAGTETIVNTHQKDAILYGTERVHGHKEKEVSLSKQRDVVRYKQSDKLSNDHNAVISSDHAWAVGAAYAHVTSESEHSEQRDSVRHVGLDIPSCHHIVVENDAHTVDLNLNQPEAVKSDNVLCHGDQELAVSQSQQGHSIVRTEVTPATNYDAAPYVCHPLTLSSDENNKYLVSTNKQGETDASRKSVNCAANKIASYEDKFAVGSKLADYGDCGLHHASTVEPQPFLKEEKTVAISPEQEDIKTFSLSDLGEEVRHKQNLILSEGKKCIASHNLKQGDQVLLKELKKTHKNAGKQQIKWKGPYTISKIFYNNMCLLSNKNRALSQKYPLDDLKPYQSCQQILPTSDIIQRSTRQQLKDGFFVQDDDEECEQKNTQKCDTLSSKQKTRCQGKLSEMSTRCRSTVFLVQNRERNIDHRDTMHNQNTMKSTNDKLFGSAKPPIIVTDLKTSASNFRLKDMDGYDQQHTMTDKEKDIICHKPMQNARRAEQPQTVCHSYKVGDCVLHRELQRSRRNREVKEHTWKGPYVISKVLQDNTFQLSWNVRILKKKYSLSDLKPYEESQPPLVVPPNTSSAKTATLAHRAAIDSYQQELVLEGEQIESLNEDGKVVIISDQNHVPSCIQSDESHDQSQIMSVPIIVDKTQAHKHTLAPQKESSLEALDYSSNLLDNTATPSTQLQDGNTQGSCELEKIAGNNKDMKSAQKDRPSMSKKSKSFAEPSVHINQQDLEAHVQKAVESYRKDGICLRKTRSFNEGSIVRCSWKTSVSSDQGPYQSPRLGQSYTENKSFNVHCTDILCSITAQTLKEEHNSFQIQESTFSLPDDQMKISEKDLKPIETCDLEIQKSYSESAVLKPGKDSSPAHDQAQSILSSSTSYIQAPFPCSNKNDADYGMKPSPSHDQKPEMSLIEETVNKNQVLVLKKKTLMGHIEKRILCDIQKRILIDKSTEDVCTLQEPTTVHSYRPGERVLVKGMKRSHKSRGEPDMLWKGPYIIAEILPDNTCELSNGKRILKPKFPFSHLKPFQESPAREISELGTSEKWIADLGLDLLHREILLSMEWLDDKIIDAAQQLLKVQYGLKEGLQTTLLSCSDEGFAPIQTHGVQIHFDDIRNHWFTTSSKGCIVELADSLPLRALSPSTQKQLKQCYGALIQQGKLEVHLLSVDRQPNCDDCGLYAIANAVEFLSSEGNPMAKYDNQAMRPHLLTCLEEKKMTPFPKCPKLSRLSRKPTIRKVFVQ
ncbi:hypothetical protein NDU88_001258 [Pleurodeles waltl]|uniref:Uncharacterized protein n=1 Tax=Pleurodeles waltl TaxID=8319 RepID=A0AAV7R6M9_PLEWA|nr:hypothetical protein NDU88_001258 [Pleurodeles waltl]